jgi:hypothetical protein
MIHLAMLWGLTWLALHPPPPLGGRCTKEDFTHSSAVIRSASLPKPAIDSSH